MSAITTTPETAKHATQIDVLDLSQSQLIGLIDSNDGPRAMLRAPDGTILTVRTNEITPLGEVTAIAPSYILLRNGDTVHRLTLPA